MYLEFVVLGPPISNQSTSKTSLATWRATVKAEATKRWTSKPILKMNLKVVLINFHFDKKPSLDVDNLSKPIFDVMQGLVYANDRQIVQAEITHVQIDAPFVFVGVTPVLIAAVQAGSQFVYVRVEDPVQPFPLPR